MLITINNPKMYPFVFTQLHYQRMLFRVQFSSLLTLFFSLFCKRRSGKIVMDIDSVCVRVIYWFISNRCHLKCILLKYYHDGPIRRSALRRMEIARRDDDGKQTCAATIWNWAPKICISSRVSYEMFSHEFWINTFLHSEYLWFRCGNGFANYQYAHSFVHWTKDKLNSEWMQFDAMHQFVFAFHQFGSSFFLLIIFSKWILLRVE